MSKVARKSKSGCKKVSKNGPKRRNKIELTVSEHLTSAINLLDEAVEVGSNRRIAVIARNLKVYQQFHEASMVTELEANNFCEGYCKHYVKGALVPPDAKLCFQGEPTHFELLAPPEGYEVTPTAKPEFSDTPIGAQLSVTLMTGATIECVHIGGGVAIRAEASRRIRGSLQELWPLDYGSSALNAKHPNSMKHRQTIDLLISSVWPGGTDSKFFALEGFPPRADFHKARVEICTKWLGDIWNTFVGSSTEYPEEKVRQFLIGRIRREHDVHMTEYVTKIEGKTKAWVKALKRQYPSMQRTVNVRVAEELFGNWKRRLVLTLGDPNFGSANGNNDIDAN